MAVKPAWGAMLAAVVTAGVLATIPWSNVRTSVTRPVAAVAQATPSATPSAQPDCDRLREELAAAAQKVATGDLTALPQLMAAIFGLVQARCPIGTPSPSPTAGG